MAQARHMERLSISLDRELARELEELQEESGDSKANLIRRALKTFLMRRHVGAGRPTERDLQVWIGLLATREHVIMDVAHVRLLFSHINGGTPEFWAELREIGEEHGAQYRDKGMSNVADILHVMECANWFLLSPESDHSWALVFTEPSAKPFVQCFLEGFYVNHPSMHVEIVPERTKLRIRATARGSTRTRAAP